MYALLLFLFSFSFFLLFALNFVFCFLILSIRVSFLFFVFFYSVRFDLLLYYFLFFRGMIIMGRKWLFLTGEMDVSFLYTKDEPLGWTYDKYSYYFGFKYGLGASVLILLSPIARRFSLQEITICCFGLVSKAAGLTLHGLANTTFQMFIVAPLSMFNTFCIPSIRSLLSKQVEPNELGNYNINPWDVCRSIKIDNSSQMATLQGNYSQWWRR